MRQYSLRTFLTTRTALLLAVLFLIVATKIGEPSYLALLSEVLRDLGIAFLVAVIVARFYELGMRRRHDLETMESILDASMGEYVPPEIWQEVKRQIIYRSVIRRDVDIRLNLTRDADLENSQAILWVEFEYELHGLTNESAKMTVKHELDYQFRNEQKDLPRYQRVVVETDEGAIEYEGPDRLAAILKDGVITLSIQLEPRGGKPVRILTERLELTNTPGSYNLYMTELTKVVRLHVKECPSDTQLEVKFRGREEGIRKAGRMTWIYDELILPGQGIEIKFKQDSDQPAQKVLGLPNKSSSNSTI